MAALIPNLFEASKSDSSTMEQLDMQVRSLVEGFPLRLIFTNAVYSSHHLRHCSSRSGGLRQLTLRSIFRIPVVDRQVMLLLAHRVLQTRPLLDGLQPLPEPGPGVLISARLSLSREPKPLLEVVENPQTQLSRKCQRIILVLPQAMEEDSPPKVRQRSRSDSVLPQERKGLLRPSPPQTPSTCRETPVLPCPTHPCRSSAGTAGSDGMLG